MGCVACGAGAGCQFCDSLEAWERVYDQVTEAMVAQIRKEDTELIPPDELIRRAEERDKEWEARR